MRFCSSAQTQKLGNSLGSVQLPHPKSLDWTFLLAIPSTSWKSLFSEVQGLCVPLGTLNWFREVKLGMVVVLVFRCEPRFMWRLPGEVGGSEAGLQVLKNLLPELCEAGRGGDCSVSGFSYREIYTSKGIWLLFRILVLNLP